MTRLIVALDLPDAKQALFLAERLKGVVSWLKVGLELFIAAGPEIVARLKRLDFQVFLDLKLYDIPNTVAGAVASAVEIGCDMLTLHLQGGARMCEAARAVSRENDLLLLGVTALTSFAPGEMPGITVPPSEFAWTLAANAREWGLSGVVCSGFEAAGIKGAFPDLFCVCPGIRPQALAWDDQRRAMTPAQAAAAGADFIVVGRPVLRASDPALAAEEIILAMRPGDSVER